jgi:homoserine dehydrogenase
MRKRRECSLPPGVLTDDAWAVVEDPHINVVIEVMGGLTPARDLIARALELGKPVVTANKAVLGEYGPQLRAVSRRQRVPLLFEAAVAGAVPIVRGLSGLSRADEIVKIEGVLNGTSTFVLSHVEATGCTPAEAVAEAQRLGYAEADATRDLDGSDAADKLAVLVQYLFDRPIRTSQVQRLGIDVLRAKDIARTDGRRWAWSPPLSRGPAHASNPCCCARITRWPW